MKFATLGHLMIKENIRDMPKDWIHDSWIYSPELNVNGTKGHITGLLLTAKEMMESPIEEIRQNILDLAVFIQDEFNVELIQLGALTTSVTSGGKWLADNTSYTGFVNHGDSYTAAVSCQGVMKSLKICNKVPSECTIAIIGAYGIIGEAISKLLVPQFNHSILIGRNRHKLKNLRENVKGDFETTTYLSTRKADVILTATSHPTALLSSAHLKENAIVVDVSQPPNLSYAICQKRPDVFRVDGGFVDLPKQIPYQIPALPKGKIFSCVAEVIMQAFENEKKDHVGSIDLHHLKKTEEWAEKYGFTLHELTNFGVPIKSD